MDPKRAEMMELISNKTDFGGYPRWYLKCIARMAIDTHEKERIKMSLEEFAVAYANNFLKHMKEIIEE